MTRRLLCWISALSLLVVADAARAAIVADFLMETDPSCEPLQPIRDLALPLHLKLWIEALGRPEIDMQRLAAESIAIAGESGVHNVQDAIPALEKILVAETSHPAARFAAARALIVLNSRDSAEKLFQISQKYGSDLKQLIEPALAVWNFEPIKAVWSKRLETPSKWPREFMLAVRGLALVKEVSALPVLKAIVFDLVLTADTRLEAASAMGQLAPTGLEEDASQLIQEKRTSRIVNRLCAIRLLAQHDSEQTRQMMTELARDTEPSIMAAALQRLNAIDPALVLPLAEQTIKNADVNVRKQAAFAYVSLPTIERVQTLAALLDDPHPALRRQICQDLKSLSEKPELNETVRNSAMEILHGSSWRGQEQASLLLGSLEHLPASKRLVELLESERSEVMITSGWALRKIADPQTTSAIMDKIARQTVIRKKNFSHDLDKQVAHLFEACGKIGAKEAEPQMLEYVPKEPVLGERSRGAAIYALGLLHAGVPDEKLANDLNDRINDYTSPPMEFDQVRISSIISIARMKAVSYADEFKETLSKGTPNGRIALARRWAVNELTGEMPPDAIPMTTTLGGWFLEPIIPPAQE